MHVVSRFLCGGLHVISAVCRDMGSSEFDYAAPGAVLILATVSVCVSVKIILFMLYKHNNS